MTIRTTKLLAFMSDAPEGKYQAPKPTDDQLTAVLPWLIDKTIKWAQQNGHCDTVNAGIANLVGMNRYDGAPKFYDADGYDCNGRDRENRDRNGYDRNGYDRDRRDRAGYDLAGYDRDGYNHRGFNRDGFNRDGTDRYGYTREQAVAKLVGGWTKAHIDLVAAKLIEREAAKAAVEAAAAQEDAAAAAAAAETAAEPAEEPVSATAA